jgi:selenocysteine lyase/cysteine desulfurase
MTHRHHHHHHRDNNDNSCYYFEATGVVANSRLSPLLPSNWIDIEKDVKNKDTTTNVTNDDDHNSRRIPNFLWENTPKKHTKMYRDHVQVYSHLPNGTSILDSKWVLGRLLSSQNDDEINKKQRQSYDPRLLAFCETHCFVGKNGFYDFAKRMKLLNDNDDDDDGSHVTTTTTTTASSESYTFHDIMEKDSTSQADPPPRPNLWVIKDATANGAGGVWVVGKDNAYQFYKSNKILFEEHKYAAQQYVWPPVLYKKKKFHIRCYVTITYDGNAYLHNKAFLHVANEPFTYTSNNDDDDDDGDDAVCFDDCIHITNCCANSHDDDKFAGEILADFSKNELTSSEDGQTIVPLGEFLPSVQATISALTEKAFPFIQGGQRNRGFEYCGMDFMLSYDEDGLPLAYLLEINAPPSQDTATGLPHAENVHNTVLQDWMNYWVVPHITNNSYRPDYSNSSNMGGWRCVHRTDDDNTYRNNAEDEEEDLILPSKAAILNKIRWALCEKKALKRDEMERQREVNNEETFEIVKGTQQSSCLCCVIDDRSPTTAASCCCDDVDPDDVSKYARSQFPYYFSSQDEPYIFLESAGGAQVPQSVIDSMTESLQCRHRSVVGSRTKALARETIRTILGASDEDAVIFGPNTTSLLSLLADRYTKHGLLSADDEVVLSTENHKANFDPWISAATAVGAKVKLWTPSLVGGQRDDLQNESFNCERGCSLEDLITPQTKIVAIPHASNILGILQPIGSLSSMIKSRSRGRAHVVVDGVAAVPHIYAGFEKLIGDVDWYVVSIHKLFGPHMGVLLARRGQAMDQFSLASKPTAAGLYDERECLLSVMESGTANIEGCAGIVGLGMYFKSLAKLKPNNTILSSGAPMSGEDVQEKRKSRNVSEQLSSDTAILSKDVEIAYGLIRKVENRLAMFLVQRFSRSSLVRILGWPPQNTDNSSIIRLPTVSFVHDSIPSKRIYEVCFDKGIICRYGFFLCTDFFASDFGIDEHTDGCVRVSLLHYNTVEDIDRLFNVLENIPGWF